jgi:hypothetical protein
MDYMLLYYQCVHVCMYLLYHHVLVEWRNGVYSFEYEGIFIRLLLKLQLVHTCIYIYNIIYIIYMYVCHVCMCTPCVHVHTYMSWIQTHGVMCNYYKFFNY